MENKKKYIVVDIDGTIAKVGGRLKYLLQSPKDWDKFYASCFNDEPYEDMVGLVKMLFRKYEIIFLTGRRESVRPQTKLWLEKHLGYSLTQASELLMRPDKDYRHDTVTKVEVLREFLYTDSSLSQVHMVLEDRDSMVRKWRELGVRTLQVQEGNF